MKFIAVGTKSIRADLIEAIQVFASTMTIFCQGSSQYTTYFDSGKQAKEEKQRIITELEKIGG